MSEFRRVRYVERVHEATRSLFEDLLEANRRLRQTVSVLSEERSDAARADLSELDKRAERWRAEQQSVLSLLESVASESRRFEEQFAVVERQNSNLASLYAAGHALHSSLDRAAVLSAIQEIVINLIGSEQFAIVAADEGLTPQALFGVRSERLAGLSPRSGLIGQAQVEARPISLLRGMSCDSTGVQVCIPLVLDEKVEGFVLIFEFLPQKEDISPLDRELFSLVGSQAATALCAAELFASRGARGAA
jgi:hypothetical protein